MAAIIIIKSKIHYYHYVQRINFSQNFASDILILELFSLGSLSLEYLNMKFSSEFKFSHKNIFLNCILKG